MTPHVLPRCGQYPASLLAASRIDALADTLLERCMESTAMREMLLEGLRLLVKTGRTDCTAMILNASADCTSPIVEQHSSEIFQAAVRIQPAAHVEAPLLPAKYSFDKHQHEIIGQPEHAPDEIISFIFSFLGLSSLLYSAATCRGWQLASRQRSASTMLSITHSAQMESLLASNTQSLLESRHLSISSLTLTPEKPIQPFFEKKLDTLLLPFCGDPETNDDEARALQRVELNGNLPFSSNVLSNMLLSSSTTLQYIDLSAGHCTITLTFPGIPFPNLYCLRGCDDWWQLDFDEGFSCDSMLYLGLRPSPAARKKLPVTWQTWLRRLEHLRRLILLVDPDDDTDLEEEATTPFHERPEARGFAADESGVSEVNLSTNTHFSEAVLSCLQKSFSELVEIRMFDYTLSGSDRAFNLIHRGIARHNHSHSGASLSKLEDLAFAAPSAIHEAKLQEEGWHPEQGEHGWGGSTVFRRSERDATGETVPNIESSPLHAETIYSPTWSSRTSTQWIDFGTSMLEHDVYSPCNTSKSAPASSS